MKEKKGFFKKIKGVFESVSAEEKMSGKMVLMLLVIVLSFLMIVICILKLSEDYKNHDNEKLEAKETTSISISTSASTQAVTEITTEEPKITVSEYILTDTMIKQTEYQQIIEAEDVASADFLTVKKDKKGYSGEGYVSGFNADEITNTSFVFDIPESQHYDISICFSSDEIVKNEIYIDKEFLFDFQCTEETVGKFVIKTYYGVFMDKGKISLNLHETEGSFDLDYIMIKNNQSIYSSITDIESSLINKSATAEANELMKYLTDNFGKKIITGQYVSDSKNVEIEKIYENTTQYPAIRFGDMSQYCLNYPNDKEKADDDISAAIKWAENGGIVGYIWHWYAPMYESEIYSENTEFSLENAVTGEDVSLLTIEEAEELCNQGIITDECLAILKDIDAISLQLKKLADKKIPVLWRPLHEASGDWFWWGDSGPGAYKWLWNLLYRRQTEYHKLNNLIWIWSAQGTEYFVGNDWFDIASVDLYNDNTNNTSYYKQYQWLYSLTEGQKLVALSECGVLPDIELTFRDRAVWSFFGLWYGDYILDKNGELSDKYNNHESFIKMYNSNRTITLEKYKNRNNILSNSVVTTSPPVSTEISVTPSETK